MKDRIKIHILRVFVNEEKKFGNPVGIVIDEGQKINTENRQRIATGLDFSESVFVNDVHTGNVSIFNPQTEVTFAGHALIGAAYFISAIIGKPIESLVCNAGKVISWKENDITWIRAGLEHTPPWHHEQLQDVSQIDNLSVFPKVHTMVWAWIDEAKGIVRARTFAPDWGIPEDQANGSGSMQLAAILGRMLEIHHGMGSIVFAKPVGIGIADVGGRVEEDLSKEIEL